MDSTLFLGFPIDKLFENELDKLNPKLLSLFISRENSKKKDDLLKKITIQDQTYLGKYLPDIENFSKIEMLEVNILSLLKKIVPDYNYGPNSLVLLTITP